MAKPQAKLVLTEIERYSYKARGYVWINGYFVTDPRTNTLIHPPVPIREALAICKKFGWDAVRPST